MARIIRLTENDLTRLVKRIIREQKGGTHSHMAHLADVLIPFGFVKLNNASTKIGDNGVFNGLSKGYDENGSVIIESHPSYFRPSEVDTLLGDCSKAKKKLGWKPASSIEDLVNEMVDHDLKNV